MTDADQEDKELQMILEESLCRTAEGQYSYEEAEDDLRRLALELGVLDEMETDQELRLTLELLVNERRQVSQRKPPCKGDQDSEHLPSATSRKAHLDYD